MRRPPVLVARLDNVGDVVLTGPAVRALAATGAPVAFLASPQGAAAARLLPGVEEVRVLHCPWIDGDPPPVDAAELDDLVAWLRSRRFERAAVLTSSHQSPLPLALLLRLGGVGRIAAVSHEYPGSLLDVRIPGDPDLHEVERSLAVAAELGGHLGPGDDAALRLALGDGPAVAIAPGAVIVHPGASVPARTWPPARWAELVGALVASGREVVVTGGPAERALTEAVAGAGAGAVDLGGRADLAGLARVLAAADAVVTGNTGPMHLAAAVGTPVVALFAPTVDPQRWRPWGVAHELLGQLDIGCRGCRARVCPVPDQPCLSVVSVEAVLAALDRVGRRHHLAVASTGARR